MRNPVQNSHTHGQAAQSKACQRACFSQRTDRKRKNTTAKCALFGMKKMPDEQPQYIGRGDENEAISYVYGSWIIWEKTEGAFDWLYDFKQKRLKMN